MHACRSTLEDPTTIRRLRRAAVRRAIVAGLAALAVLVSLNLSVRRLGGDVHPLSSARAPERAKALALLLRHWAFERDAELEPEAALRAAAARHGVSAQLVLSVARVESSLVHTRISGTGAMGLMQLMPDTARSLGVDDPFDANENADGGVRYLKQLLRSYRGNLRKALAAYNAGPSRVPSRRALAGLPYETTSYVARIMSML